MLFNQMLKEEMISKLADNLPAIRARMKISQSDLAEAVGIGRQTLMSIENGSSKMRWDTFLALLFILSTDPDAKNLMNLLGLKFEDTFFAIGEDMCNRKNVSQTIQDKLWTDVKGYDNVTIRGFAPLPLGLNEEKCPKCGKKNLRGALITKTADQLDPNILCMECGYWRE